MKKEAIFSLIFAIAIIGGALWVADRSLTKQEVKPTNSQSLSATSQNNSPGIGKQSTSPTADNSNSSAIYNPDTPKGVSKCIMGDKTVYADNGCPAGAKAVNLTLHDSAGIVSPPKESLDELTAKRHAKERKEAVAMQQPMAAPQMSKKMECERLDKYIRELDAMGHQPQSGYMMDWIRQQRYDARNSQFKLGC